jgi:hypothetical protein
MEAAWNVVERELTVAERLERLERLEVDSERLSEIVDDLALELGRSVERARRAHSRALVREYKAAHPGACGGEAPPRWLVELLEALSAWREFRGSPPRPPPLEAEGPSEASVRAFLRGVTPNPVCGGGEAEGRAMLEFGAAAMTMSLDEHEDFALWDEMPDLEVELAGSKGPGENPGV